IRTVLRALDEATRVRRSDGGLLPLVVTLATVIVDAMGVEDALSCSCPVALGERSTAIVALGERVLAQEIELDGGPAGARALVRSDAETTRSYFDKLTEVAAAAMSFVEGDAPGPAPYVDHAVQALEVGLEGDVYESERRAHRACLEALQQRAIESRLRVDAGELVYLYPFALDGVDQKKAVERDSVDRAVAGLASIRLDTAAAHERDLNDLWDR